ncbi:MAG TPA: PilZ domain-containing protein [Candidatus Acidoferrum sp.]|nr:PilZ domain-containing protein [Candidatus Acidoferrum sp.]
MPNDATKSNRRFDRISTPKGLWVAWQHNGNQSVSRVRDLNAGGLFIATPTSVPVGAVIQVLLSVPEGEIRSEATVRNVTPGAGVGIEFKDMSPQDADRLGRLITRLLRAGPGEAA